jgi:Mycothiol maleylpyruvate isomerase N-terminal domain
VPPVAVPIVLTLFDEGVAALESAAARLDDDGWSRPACGDWTATELVRHVLCVSGWYHDWLDRAQRGDAAPPFGLGELAARNAEALELEEITALAGPGAMERFVESARAYRERLVTSWDLPYGYPRGTVTAGLHAGTAACEWHLHAWDLAGAGGTGHRPSDPAGLYRAAGACRAAADGGAKGTLAAALVPLGAWLRPWEALLRRSGRAPGPGD